MALGANPEKDWRAVARWLRGALQDLRKQLTQEHHGLLDQVWQLMKEQPPDGNRRLYELWRGIPVRRSRDRATSALYRLRLLILRLYEHWEKYTLDQRDPGVPPTNNGTERAIGKWRLCSHSTRGFKSWAGFEGAFLLCGSEIERSEATTQRGVAFANLGEIHPPGS